MKYEQRVRGKPYTNSSDDIEEQLSEINLNGLNKQSFKEKQDILSKSIDSNFDKELSDYFIETEDPLTDTSVIPRFGESFDYQEVISLKNQPLTTYCFSTESLKELSRCIGEEDYDSSNLESLTRDAIRKGIVYVKQGGFREEELLDYTGKLIIELNPLKFILTSYEFGEDLTEKDVFLEIQTNNSLPGDVITMDYLDLNTKKKINNLNYGGSTHEIFEPFDHEWENEHFNE